MDIMDFFLKYLVCPWEEATESCSMATMIFTIGMLVLVIIMISLNNKNDFNEEVKALRKFIYLTCIFLVPCFAILLPIYFFIPAMILSILEIKKKEKIEIERLYKEYEVNTDFSIVYKSSKANIKIEVVCILVSSVFIISIMQLIGYHYNFLPVLPNCY